jgi:Icc-related predicted phosphoesterase
MSANEPRKPVKVAAVGDLHVHDKPVDRSLRIMLSNVSKQADVLALCGDLTTLGLASEARNLASELKQCTIPIVAVLGNHDHESGHCEDVKRILSDANVHFLGEETFVHLDVGFAGVKGFCGGFGRYMLTSFGEDGIKKFVGEALHETLRLETALQRLPTDKNVVVLHYSPIAGTLKGEPPEIYPFLGSSRLAETIDAFDEVSAIVHGHAHHGTYEGRTNKGVPVYNTCLELLRARNPDQPYVLLEI